MSRSYKSTPGHCDRNPFMKNYANRRIRRYKGEIQSGGSYKKYSCPWNICDFKCLYYTEKEVRYAVNNWDYERYELFMK